MEKGSDKSARRVASSSDVAAVSMSSFRVPSMISSVEALSAVKRWDGGERMTDWLLRLSGFKLPTPSDTARTQQTGPAMEAHAKEKEPVSCAQTYDFTKAKPLAQTTASPSPSKKPSADNDSELKTPPDADAGGSSDVPKPTTVLRGEWNVLLRKEAPYVAMDAFLRASSKGDAGTDETVFLLDASRARIPNTADSYYHASLVDGYSSVSQFLLAQAPTPGRERAFWALLLGHATPLLVVLGTPRADSPFYPPKTATQPDVLFETGAGKLYVRRDGPVRRNAGFSLSKIRVRLDSGLPTEHEQSLELAELDWDYVDLVPPDIIRIVAQLISYYSWHVRGNAHKKKKNVPPMGVVCADGARRSGTFAAAAIALQRFMDTGEMELQETVAALRLQRYGALQIQTHYLSLHLALLQHLGLVDKMGKVKPNELERLEAQLADLVRATKAQARSHSRTSAHSPRAKAFKRHSK